MSFTVDFLQGSEALASPEIRSRWLELLSSTGYLRGALQTPQRIEFRSHFAGNLIVGLVRDPSRQIIGLIPLLENNYPIDFVLSGKSLFKLPMDGAMLIGGIPISPPFTEIYTGIFNALADKTHIQSVFIPGILKNTEFWAFLADTEKSDDSKWSVYRSKSDSIYYSIQMPNTFDEYYHETFDSNMRRNFRREPAQLKKLAGGDLKLMRIESVDQVAEFLTEAAAIAAKSWQKRLIGLPFDKPAPRFKFFADLAERRMLRSYLLKCGDVTCAYAICYQCDRIFYYYEIAYDPKWSAASPGKVLLYLILEDLFEHERPEIFHFGAEAFDYKRWFANRHGEEGTVYLSRKTLANRLKFASHQAFDLTVSYGKRILRGS